MSMISVQKLRLVQLIKQMCVTVGMNTDEDTLLYHFQEVQPGEEGVLKHLAGTSGDKMLTQLVAEDVAGPRWIADLEDHAKNLPPDPTQASRSSRHVQCPQSIHGHMCLNLMDPQDGNPLATEVVTVK